MIQMQGNPPVELTGFKRAAQCANLTNCAFVLPWVPLNTLLLPTALLSRSGWGEGVPQGTYAPPAKVPTPPPVQVRTGRRGYPKVPSTYPPAKVPTPIQVRTGKGVPQGTYLSFHQGTYPPMHVRTGGRGYPKVSTPRPRYLPSPPPG